jgi:hypothetical protein
MTHNTRSQADQTTAVKLIIIGRAGKYLLTKGLLIAIGAVLVFPSCKSHKLCEAYSDSRPLKHTKTGSASSTHTTTRVGTHNI